jgi:hypothetical protein
MDDAITALLETHCPLFFRDRHETISLISMSEYVASGSVVPDDSIVGTVVYISPFQKHLHYFMFYDSDGGMPCCGRAIGSHKYDLEHMIVEITHNTLTGVCYMPHGTAEWYWIRGQSDLQKITNGGLRPIVYSSRGKHASYPVSGTIYRYLGFANDHCVPVTCSVTVQRASDALLSVDLIDGVFAALKPRIVGPFSQHPTVPLSSCRTRMLRKIPSWASIRSLFIKTA